MGIILLEDSGHRMELAIYSCVNEGLYSNLVWLKAVKHSSCSKEKLNKCHPSQLKTLNNQYYGSITENVLSRKSHEVPNLSNVVSTCLNQPLFRTVLECMPNI